MISAMRSKPFNLLRSFSLLSFLSIAFITVISTALLSRFMTNNTLARDGMVTMQFVQGITHLYDPTGYFVYQSSPHLDNFSIDPASFHGIEMNNTAMEKFFTHIVAIPEVVRANVYNSNSEVIWSSQADLIGKRYLDNPELRAALMGQLIIETGTVQPRRKAEHVEFAQDVSRFVEYYIPIWDTPKHKIVGVVEVYKAPHALFGAIAKGQRLVWGSAIVGGLFLYVSLFWIVRRATQLIQRQQEQLVEAETMATVGEMASAIAHNLRNPLASIRSSAEIAIEEEASPLVQEIAQGIILAVDRLEQWIRELLVYVRPLPHARMPVQLNSIIQNVLQDMQIAMSNQHVKLLVDLTEPLPPLSADASLLQQACHSVIVNALEAMPNGGTLTIRSLLSTNGKWIRLDMRDSGAGIPQDQLDKIFRPFFTTKRKGLGVGLSLVKRIVERHGGTIVLTSEEKQGTTVSFAFPLTESKHVIRRFNH
jgi:signal transduction histidine kinase